MFQGNAVQGDGFQIGPAEAAVVGARPSTLAAVLRPVERSAGLRSDQVFGDRPVQSTGRRPDAPTDRRPGPGGSRRP